MSIIRPWAVLLILLLAGACAGNAPDPAQAERDKPKTGEIDPYELERLRSLGYVSVGAPLQEDAEVGVLKFDRELAQPGLNLFTNSHFCSTQLIDMAGTVLHEWSYDPCFRWGNAVVLPQGDLLVVGRTPHDRSISEEALAARYIMRMGWNGDIRWQRRISVHHDVELAPDGRILTLTFKLVQMPDIHPTVPVRDHLLVMLSPEGEVLEEVSMWELLHSAPDLLTVEIPRPRKFDGARELDVFHSNSIEWMRRRELIGTDSIFGANHVLFCLRNQDTLAIVDWNTKKLVWAWGKGELSGPHDATMLPNGNILAFDNGLGRAWSRVVEVDPIARKIVWDYRAPDPESFYTATRGANHRLGNGNTLITESDNGRAFEVTPDGKIVWEFLNPNLTEKREPSVIVRMRRFDGIDFSEFKLRVDQGRLDWVD